MINQTNTKLLHDEQVQIISDLLSSFGTEKNTTKETHVHCHKHKETT